MNKILVVLLALLFGLSGNAMAKSRIYGKGVSLLEVTKISQILDTPDSFIGKRIKISGMIIEVCASRGCWVYVASDRPYEKIQVKVTDGKIVFPMSASGKLAEVEGIVEELKLSRKDLIRWKQHQAEERGVKFDPSTVTAGEKIVRLRGLGAVVQE